jgi:hypothetical protein
VRQIELVVGSSALLFPESSSDLFHFDKSPEPENKLKKKISCLCLPSARITDMCYHTQPEFLYSQGLAKLVYQSGQAKLWYDS